jgi:hypothetical protein
MANDLRAKVIRLAAANPELRPHLLPLIRSASAGLRGSGGLIFNLSRGFAVRTMPTDPPYNQTYDGLILVDRGGKKPFAEALRVVAEFQDEIFRLKRLGDVAKFVDQKVQERVGKAPGWHQYSMPD